MDGPSLSVEMWATGITWLCLGMSIFQLPSLLLGEDKTLSATPDTRDDISKPDNSTDEMQ